MPWPLITFGIERSETKTYWIASGSSFSILAVLVNSSLAPPRPLAQAIDLPFQPYAIESLSSSARSWWHCIVWYLYNYC